MSSVLVILVIVLLFMSLIAAIIVMLTRNTEPLPPSQDLIDHDALQDERVQAAIDAGEIITAIKLYRQVANADLRTSQAVITYVMANPDALKKGKRPDAPAADGAGIHDLIAAGKVEEAVEVYAAFNGVDQFTARAAVLERVAQMSDDDQAST